MGSKSTLKRASYFFLYDDAMMWSGMIINLTRSLFPAGLTKSAIGALAGGVFGMILFRSGKGMRAASISAGVGVAIGSTYERYIAKQS